MVRIYNSNEFDNWYHDFEDRMKCQINKKQIDILNTWKDLNISLNSFLPLDNYSFYGECFVLNDNIIVKTSSKESINSLYEKYLTYPILEKYIVPTYIYLLEKKHQFSFEHIMKLKKQDRIYTSDCLILQPKCAILKTSQSREVFNQWLVEQKNLYSLKNKLDINNNSNVGFYKNEMKYFDW